VAERFPYLALVVVTVALIAYGFRERRRRGKPADRAFASKLAWTSVGLASALVGVILPATWTFVSFVVYGGRLEENVPPGYSLHFVFGASLLGCAFTAVSAAYGYGEHLDS
jgi:uncharacterized membrane protein YfcA